MQTFTCLLLWLCFCASLEASPPCYRVTDIGANRSGQSVFINSSGQVAGSYFAGSSVTAENGGLHGFLWEHGKRTYLSLPPAYTGTIVCGINNHEQIAGNLDDTTDGAVLVIVSHAFFWKHGKMLDLGAPGSEKVSEARGINDKGEIVGRAYISGRPVEDDPALTEHHAFVCRNGQFTDLGLGEADAINSKGQIAGEIPGSVHVNAALWIKGQVVNLGIWGSASAINNKGKVLIQNANVQPVVWQNWHIQLLPILSWAAATTAISLNNRGQIVGYAWSKQNHWSAQKQRALLWQHGSVYNLNSSIAPHCGWVLTSATGINDKGQIVGNGLLHGQAHMFLLTPITYS